MRKNLRVLSLALIGLLLFAASLVWLWQRQPKSQQAISFLEESQESTPQAQKESNDLEISPKDGLVLTQNLVKFKGKASADTFVTIYSNDFQTVTRATKSGDFEKEVELANGLNLITLAILNQKQELEQEKSLTLFVTEESVGNTVFAGSVKSIFDTLVTITTPNGDRSVRTSKSTKIDVPQEEQSTGPAIKNIRVGDYAIALGNAQDKDTQVATSLQIIRDDKPQNTKVLTKAVIITNVKNNLFSAKKVASGEIAEFSLAKQSKVEKDDSPLKITDITRDKNAFIFYHPEKNQNIVDLVFLLP